MQSTWAGCLSTVQAHGNVHPAAILSWSRRPYSCFESGERSTTRLYHRSLCTIGSMDSSHSFWSTYLKSRSFSWRNGNRIGLVGECVEMVCSRSTRGWSDLCPIRRTIGWSRCALDNYNKVSFHRHRYWSRRYHVVHSLDGDKMLMHPERNLPWSTRKCE
jgi:hypothetical protein